MFCDYSPTTPYTPSEQIFINRVIGYTKKPLVGIYNPQFKKTLLPPGFFAYLEFETIRSDEVQAYQVYDLFKFLLDHKQEFRSLKINLYQDRKFIIEKIQTSDD